MTSSKPKPGNPLVGVLINIAIPVVILTVLSKEKYLGPVRGMIAALLFPIIYGTHTLIRERRVDFIAALGIVSVLLTGIFSILQLPPEWIACKEASVPLLIGLAIVISLKTPCPLIRKILMSRSLFDVDLLHARLHEKGNEQVFEKQLTGLTWGFASSLFLSAGLNYGLAKAVLRSPPGTEAFAAEVGRMTGLSYIVVTLPCMTVMILVLVALVRTLTGLTGLKLDDMLAEELREKAAPKGPSSME